MKFPNEILKEAKDKVIVEYKLIDDLHKLAEGNLYFNGIIVKFISGPYGKGYMARGNYAGYKLISEVRSAFMQHGLGWQIPLRNTDTGEERGYGLHPDGNIRGSKGCIAIRFDNLNENVALRNKFKDYFDRKDILNVKII